MILFSVGIMGWGIYVEMNIYNKINSFNKTSGGISSYDTKVESDDEGTSTTYAPIYTYMVDMQYYSLTGSYSSNKPKIGKSVTIYYNPDNYSDSICLEEEKKSGGLLISDGLGFLVVVLGFIIFEINKAKWVAGLGLVILGGGIIVSVPGFQFWKIILAIFPLVGLFLIWSDIAEKTGLDKKLASWKKKNYPDGFEKPEIIQGVQDYLEENDRKEKVIKNFNRGFSLIGFIPFVVGGIAFIGTGIMLAIFDFIGYVVIAAGVFMLYIGIKGIITTFKN